MPWSAGEGDIQTRLAPGYNPLEPRRAGAYGTHRKNVSGVLLGIAPGCCLRSRTRSAAVARRLLGRGPVQFLPATGRKQGLTPNFQQSPQSRNRFPMSIFLTLAAPTFVGMAALPAVASEQALPITAPADIALAPALYGAPLPAAYLATMIQDDTEPMGYFEDWSGGVQLGAARADGNSKSLNADLTVHAVKENLDGEAVKDRWTFDAFYHYAEGEFDTGGGVFESRATRKLSGAGVKYDRYLDARNYLWGAGSILHDSIAGVNSRIIFGAGVGRILVDDADLRYAVELGLSYVIEDLKGGTPTFDPDSEYLAARIAHILDWQIAANLALHHDAELFPSLEDSDDFYAKANTDLRYTLSENLSVGAAWLLLYDNTPATGNDRVDNVYSLTIGWLL